MQGAQDLGQRSAATAIAQAGQLQRVAFAGEDGADDALSAHPIDLAKDVMDVQVHFGENLLHELDLLAGLGDEVGAVTHQIAQGDDLAPRAKTRAQLASHSDIYTAHSPAAAKCE